MPGNVFQNARSCSKNEVATTQSNFFICDQCHSIDVSMTTSTPGPSRASTPTYSEVPTKAARGVPFTSKLPNSKTRRKGPCAATNSPSHSTMIRSIHNGSSKLQLDRRLASSSTLPINPLIVTPSCKLISTHAPFGLGG